MVRIQALLTNFVSYGLIWTPPHKKQALYSAPPPPPNTNMVYRVSLWLEIGCQVINNMKI